MIKTCSILLALAGVAAADGAVDFDKPLPRLIPDKVIVPHDIDRDRAPMSPHFNVGLEMAGGPSATSTMARIHGGVSFAFGRGRVRPMVGGGMVFAAGVLGADDLRALDGSVNLGYLDFGPELQLGLRFVNGGIVDTRLFASVSHLRVELDGRLKLDAIEGVGGTKGTRATIGMSWADRQGRAIASLSGEGIALAILPQQIELGWIQSGGSNRFGITLSYGI